MTVRALDYFSEICGLSRSQVIEGLVDFALRFVKKEEGEIMLPFRQEFLEKEMEELPMKVRGYQFERNGVLVSDIDEG